MDLQPRAQPDEEIEWLRQQGPWCPALLDTGTPSPALRRPDLLYLPLRPDRARVRIAPHKSILVPTAHDEPAIRLEIYKELFSLPAGIAYNTEVERRFLTTHFSMRAVEEETVGCGVDLPQAQQYPRDPQDGPAPPEEGADDSPTFRPHLAKRGTTFRRRHRLDGPIALYGGRIDPGKGCEELIEYFSAYVGEGGDASLVLMGVKLMPLPEEPFIRFAGRLSDQETNAGARSGDDRGGALAV